MNTTSGGFRANGKGMFSGETGTDNKLGETPHKKMAFNFGCREGTSKTHVPPQGDAKESSQSTSSAKRQSEKFFLDKQGSCLEQTITEITTMDSSDEDDRPQKNSQKLCVKIKAEPPCPPESTESTKLSSEDSSSKPTNQPKTNKTGEKSEQSNAAAGGSSSVNGNSKVTPPTTKSHPVVKDEPIKSRKRPFPETPDFIKLSDDSPEEIQEPDQNNNSAHKSSTMNGNPKVIPSSQKRHPLKKEEPIRNKKRAHSFPETPDYINLSHEPPPKLQKHSQTSSHNSACSSSSGVNSREPVTSSSKDKKQKVKNDKSSAQIFNFFTQNQQKNDLLKKKRQLQTALENVVNRTLRLGARIFLVGSSINGFGRMTSDADFCLVVDKRKERLESRSVMLRILWSLHGLLNQAPFARNVQVIPAKVPILKFTDTYSGVDCDININNLTGIRNTELLKGYALLDRRVKPLVLFVKEWAHQRNINDASQGTLSSYSLVLMIINFLQCGVNPSVLPSLQKEESNVFRPTIPLMDIARCTDRMRQYQSPNMMQVFTLLLKFLEYYGTKFDFQSKVMSVRLGTTFSVKEVGGNSNEWTRPIKIEEPYDRSNTARAVYNDLKGNKIKNTFRDSFHLLQRTKNPNCLIKVRKPTGPVIVID